MITENDAIRVAPPAAHETHRHEIDITHTARALWSDGQLTIECRSAAGTEYRLTLNEAEAKRHMQYLDHAAELLWP